MSRRHPLPRSVAEYDDAVHQARSLPNNDYWRSRVSETARQAIWDLRNEYARIARKLEEFERQQDQSYDRQVASVSEPDGCSCHFNPPCSWCVDQPDPDEADAARSAREGE